MSARSSLRAPSSQKKQFRYGVRRAEEFRIQQEIADIKKQSVDVSVNLQEHPRSRDKQPNEASLQAGVKIKNVKLAEDFGKKRMPFIRNTEPVFQEDYLSKPVPLQEKVVDGVPPYNPLDKGIIPPKLPKTKKHPYSRETIVNVNDFTTPHVQTVGVVPVRSTKDITELNVMMQGKPAISKESQEIAAIQQANEDFMTGSPAITPATSAVDAELMALVDVETPAPTSDLNPPVKEKKPAILGSVGTIAPVKFTERAQPKVEALVKTQKKPKSSKSSKKSSKFESRKSGTSLMSEFMFDSDDESYISEGSIDLPYSTSDSPNGVTHRSASRRRTHRQISTTSPTSQKSISELVAEAADIASPDSVPLHKRGRERKESKSRGKFLKTEKGRQDEHPKDRSVDDIIASLKATRDGKGPIKTEADMKIQEIMERVMRRTSTVVGSPDGKEGLVPQEPQGASAQEEEEDIPVAPSISVTTDYDGHDGVVSDHELAVKPSADVEQLPDIPELENASHPVTTDLSPTPYDVLPSPMTSRDDEHPTNQQESAPDVPIPVITQEEIDLEAVWRDLTMPHDVTYEDIVNIEGSTQPLQSKVDARTKAPNIRNSVIIPVRTSSVSFLSTWAPQDKPPREQPEVVEDTHHSVHHFCTMPREIVLPKHLQMSTRMHHTPSKFKATAHLRPDQNYIEAETPDTTVFEDRRQRAMSAAAKRILSELDAISIEEEEEVPLSLWQKKAEQVFDEGLGLIAEKVPIRQDASRLYWNPAPPKMDLPPTQVRDTLFPDFLGVVMEQESVVLSVAGDDEDDNEDDVALTDLRRNEEEIMFRNRLLRRQHRSLEDLRDFGLTKENVSSHDVDHQIQGAPQDAVFQGPFKQADSSSKKESGSMSDLSSKKDENAGKTEDAEQSGTLLRRNNSAPDLTMEEHLLFVESDFDACMIELYKQKDQIEEMKLRIMEDQNRVTPEMEEVIQIDEQRQETTSVTPEQKPYRRDHSPTQAEQARQGGLKYVMYPKATKKKPKKPLDPKRLEQIESFLKRKARTIERRHSFDDRQYLTSRKFKTPRINLPTRRTSLPMILNFEEFMERNKDIGIEVDTREWVRGIWDEWFEEVFPENPPDEDSGDEEGGLVSLQVTPVPVTPLKKRASVASSAISVNIDAIEPLLETEEDRLTNQDLQEECLRLTEVINNSDRPTAFDLGRRGAIYRKLGKISQAWDDLNQAIELEPLLLDAYWHRHLLLLLKDKPIKALEDLNAILRINKEHVGAYKSRAEIFRAKDDVTMAIVNYTQTIKLAKDDYDAYYKRAEMYEKRGEMLLALEDYREASRLMPSKTDAIFKRGFYQFNNNKNWMAAIKDFSEMLLQEPHNATARTYRGRAYAKQGMYREAISDLSAAVHLDPYNSVAFYHRGCLLRKAHPQQALQDLSVSVLLDDSDENVMAFYHRGILYADMGRYYDAIADFENVLRLDKTIAAAHVNAGLIYLYKLDNYPKSIQKFTSAVKVDPTYERALVCRGEAYSKIHKQKEALKDFTRAIHLRPDKQHYYMFRGQTLLKMRNLELASFCVKHASELSHGLGSSPTQQAAVQSFLQNYTKAIDVLVNAVKVQPNAPAYILLGKTQIKAKKFRNAVESLENALEFMKPWNDRQAWPEEAAEVYYLIGMCHMEIPNHLKAFEAFNSAIRIKPDYPEAYYQRGLTRMKLHQNKGILDFNRALSLNPKLFQAYLSRAAYYGMKGRYSKGIFNCNEAIKLQPKSVRAFLYRGALKYYIQAYNLAIQDLSKAIELDTACSLAYFNRAVCYHTMQDFSKAQRDYGIVLMLGEEDALKVLINRGLMYYSQKDYKNAREDFSQAVKMSPRDPKIRHTLAICCHKLDRLEEAVKIYSDTLSINQFFLDAYVGRANVLMDFGHDVTTLMARRDYERASHMNPLNLEARVCLAFNLQICGKFKQAWNHLTACLQINPRYLPALEARAVVCLQMSEVQAALLDFNLAIRIRHTAELHTNRGVVHQFMGDLTNAMQDYQAAIKLDPMYALAFFNAANLYFHNRQFFQALEYYNRTLELNPDDEAATMNRAITKVLLRDAKGALADFQQAAAMSPYSAHIFFNRGNLFASLRQYHLAETDYSRALQLQPDDPMVHKRRADILGKLGKREAAMKDYQRAIDLQSKRLVLAH